VLLVAIANAQSYGAGMRIAPRASVTDGLLDLVVVEQLGRLEFVRAFPRVFAGTHDTHPAVSMWQAREVVVHTAGPQPVLIDGDLRGETPLTVKAAPGRGQLWWPGAAG